MYKTRFTKTHPMEANILRMDRYDKADSHFSQLYKWPKNVEMYVSIFEWVILVLGRGSTENALSGELALKGITDVSRQTTKL
jgi:hypothetical protein